jgi:PASTA domain-containing protein
VRRAIALAVLALASPAGASAQEPPEFNAKCGDLDCRVERVPAKWQVLSVDGNSRTLNLVYESGGCRLGDGKPTITETRTRIRISVDEGKVVAIDTPDRQVVCTLEIRYRRLTVQLRRPVAGRPIRGDSPIVGPAAERVPRVIDLAFEDARAALRSQGFRVRRFAQRHGSVTFQSPAPGRVVHDRRVGLTLGRHAFDARALKGCLEKAGIPAVAGRPSADEEDAPDLELVLQPGPPTFVALYADPGRARENAPQIRRNARRFDGIVERLGRVTIIWVKPPSADRRTAVRGCVAGARP